MITLQLHAGSFICSFELNRENKDVLLLRTEMLKNRSNSITCMKLSQYEKMAEFMISKFCCNDKTSSVRK